MLPDEYEGKIHYLSAAGNQFQNNLLRAINKKHEVKALSYINYPVEIKAEYIEKECVKQGIEPVFTADHKLAVLRYQKKLKQYLSWADLIITYNVMYAWFRIASLAQKQRKPSVVIVADYTSPSEVHSFLRKIYAVLIAREIKKYRKAVILSPETEKYLCPHQEKILINGCVQWKNFKEILYPHINNTINLVYTGGLSYNNGTDQMLKAFSRIKDENLRLYICGQGGPQQAWAEQRAQEDPRIILLGFVSRACYYELLNKSHILINPRNMNVEQNTVNFPSKVLEYLASGRYVVSTKFRGYEEYQKYFIFIESTEEGLYHGMSKALTDVKTDCCGRYIENRRAAQMLDWDNMVEKFLRIAEKND